MAEAIGAFPTREASGTSLDYITGTTTASGLRSLKVNPKNQNSPAVLVFITFTYDSTIYSGGGFGQANTESVILAVANTPYGAAAAMGIRTTYRPSLHLCVINISSIPDVSTAQIPYLLIFL